VVLLQSMDFRVHGRNPVRVMAGLLICVRVNKLRDIVDKIGMRSRKMRVGDIPSDGVAGAGRDRGRSARSKQGCVVSLVILKVGRWFGGACGAAERWGWDG
jgi:hypothetical protein